MDWSNCGGVDMVGRRMKRSRCNCTSIVITDGCLLHVALLPICEGYALSWARPGRECRQRPGTRSQTFKKKKEKKKKKKRKVAWFVPQRYVTCRN